MQKFVNIIDTAVRKFWMLFCIVIFLLAIVIKALYSMHDYPYFSKNTWADILFLLLFITGYSLLYYFSPKIEKKVKYWMLWIFFGIVGVTFILLIPLKPFSDMKYVADGALLFAKRDIDSILTSDYLQHITKNMKVSVFYSFFILFLPKTVLSLRLVNVLFYLLIAQFMSMTAKNLGFQCSKLVYIVTGSFLPLLLYCNHIYFDLPTLLMCTLALYFYTRGKNTKNMLCCALCIGIGSCLRVLAFLVLVAILIDYIFRYKKALFEDKAKRLIVFLSMIIIAVGIPKACDKTLNMFFRAEGAQNESIWDLFWMGINEEEFGFMHNEIAGGGSKSFSDFYNLLISRNLKQNCRLFGRKIFWEWSQGTYQAQRYGFGVDAEYSPDGELSKFDYHSPVTSLLLNDDQIARQLINSFCRSQYLALFLFMILGLFNLKRNEMDKYRVFIYLMFGTFLILIFYELKSRYILHCIIPMMMLALRGLENTKKISQSVFKKLADN